MAETDYAGLAQLAREAAAQRMREAQLPSRQFLHTGRGADPDAEAARVREGLKDYLIPQSPADVALLAAGGPFGKLAKIGLVGLGATLQSSEAEAGLAKVLKPAVIPQQKILTPAGLPRKGVAFNEAAKQAAAETEALPKGTGPLDLSRASELPEAPQVPIDRYVPPRGVSPRLQEAIENPDVQRGVLGSMREGVKMGADKWYRAGPLRDAFVEAFGPEEGARRMALYTDMVAASSPRSDVSTNIRNASLLYQHALADKDLPSKLPYPYGHIAQKLHRQNFERVTAGELSPLSRDYVSELTPWDTMQNPKPASFSQNLQGNLVPVTVDTHAFRNIGMRTEDPRFLGTTFQTLMNKAERSSPDTLLNRYGKITGEKEGKLKVTFQPQDLYKSGRLSMDEALQIPSFWTPKPNPNEYGAAEQFYTGLGKKLGLQPADAQAAAWSGGGELTGLGSPPTHTFLELLNQRVTYTSKIRREDPADTLRYFMEGKKPLFSVAGGAAAAPAVLGESAQQPEQLQQ